MRTTNGHDETRKATHPVARRARAAFAAFGILGPLLFAVGVARAAPWASHGPVGGNGMAVAVDPESGDFYAGTNGGGFFKSTDGGASWTAINGGVENVGGWHMEVLVVGSETPGRVYAAASSGTSGGVFRTTNGGASWTFYSLGALKDVAVAASDPSTLYAVGNAVYKSTNGGDTWSTVLSGSTYHSVAVDPADADVVYAGTIFGSIAKSTNGGASWTSVGGGLPSDRIDALAIDPSDSNVVWAGVEDFGVYKSFDAGTTWTSFSPNTGPTPFSVQDLEIDPGDPSVVYAAGYVSGTAPSVGVHKTTNGGESWTPTTLVALTRAVALDPANPEVLLAGTQDGLGLWTSADGGASWDVANDGLVNTNVGAFATVPSEPGTVYAATGYDGVFRSEDGGESWLPTAFTGDLGQFFAIATDPTAAGTAYLGTESGGIHKTVNGGASWTPLGAQNVPIVISAIVVNPASPQTVYAAGFPFVSRSTTGGETWSFLPTGMTGIPLSLVMDPATPSTLYAGTDPALGPFTGVFKSTNGGDLWSPVNAGLPAANGRAVQALAIDPATPSTLYAGLEGAGLYKSVDGGASWAEANVGLASVDVRSIAIDPEVPSTVYAATGGQGVFVSTDGAASWAPSNAGLYNRFVRTLAVEPGRLYAGTVANGAFVADTDGLPPQAIRGKSIVIQNPVPNDPSRRKVTIVASESGASFPLDVDALLANGAILAVTAGGAQVSSQTFWLPAGSWKRSGSTGAVYTDKAGANGPVASVKVSKSSSGVMKLKVKILGKSDLTLHLVPPNPGTDAQVRLEVGGGATYCVGFGGAAGGTVKNAGPFLFRVTNPTSAGCS